MEEKPASSAGIWKRGGGARKPTCIPPRTYFSHSESTAGGSKIGESESGENWRKGGGGQGSTGTGAGLSFPNISRRRSLQTSEAYENSEASASTNWRDGSSPKSSGFPEGNCRSRSRSSHFHRSNDNLEENETDVDCDVWRSGSRTSVGDLGGYRGKHGKGGQSRRTDRTQNTIRSIGAIGGLSDKKTLVIPSKDDTERKSKIPAFGFKKLHSFLSMSTNEVLKSINKDMDEWRKLLESKELIGEWLIMVIQILGEKICVDLDDPVYSQLRNNALIAACNLEVTSKMEGVVEKIMFDQCISTKRNLSHNTALFIDTSSSKVMTNLFQLCDYVMKSMPQSGADYFQGVIIKSVGALAIRDDLSPGLKEQFEMLAKALKEKKKKVEDEKAKKAHNVDYSRYDAQTPPDCIQDIPVIPTVDELCGVTKPFLRPNKANGAYNDCDHYIDVQFRLLREDFARPLREGIQTFLKDSQDYIMHRKKMPFGEVRLFTNVQINSVTRERSSIVYKLQLEEHSYRRIKWERSKRLLPGCLVVLTTQQNYFQPENTHFGIVFSRNVDELEDGIVTVSWEGHSPKDYENKEYLMFESEVYLEAYRYTLEILKKLELDEFTMKKFIVEADNTVNYPQYLQDANKALELKLKDGLTIQVSHEDGSQWPTAEELGLDDNQLSAFRAAVTKEFSIIQGPPGTGKTFLGLKVAETLLDNGDLWKGDEGNPITVVCYTNHALDQFLEGIWKYYRKQGLRPSIIRIGGRSKSETLKDCSLWEARRGSSNRLPSHYIDIESAQKRNIRSLETERAKRMGEVAGMQALQGLIQLRRLSVYHKLESEFPSILLDQFAKASWFGIDDLLVDFRGSSEEEIVRKIFRIRRFPKAKPKINTSQKKQKVKDTNPNPDAVEDKDEENYDLDELMEKRVDVGEILLEAETSQYRQLPYIDGYSVWTSEDREQVLKVFNKLFEREAEGKSPAEADRIAIDYERQLTEFENRNTLLETIFQLYNEQYLELPDVETNLEQIKENDGAVDYTTLSFGKRWSLYFVVVERARILTAESIADIESELARTYKDLESITQQVDAAIVRNCQVVGLTTTGAAKYNNLLQLIQSKIVIVEEAAEIFEAHIVTSITKSCEQLILIGDHLQLRPNPTVYELARKFNLDLSLFERMLNNNLHCYTLKIQHRMRPDISDLVRDTIYKELHDHESVRQYPSVKGLAKNIFFINHSEKERSESDSTSKSNEHEANFLAALCRHLILQGYKPDQITVLTTYTGQMFLLKRKVHALETCQGIRVTCVDNFQGEENDIILLSLVRSNDDGKIGFLSIANRICVALSRAKHGLYVIGNLELMEGHSPTWKAIISKLQERDQIGTSLEVLCQVHETVGKVTYAHDFKTLSPEGGCNKMCDAVLPCSHSCIMFCHIHDREHTHYRCPKTCLKQCSNLLHPCKGLCSQQCPMCLDMIKKTLPCPYQHVIRAPCFKQPESIVCREVVKKVLPCGHEEELACYVQVEDYECKVKVTRTLPCGHDKTLECHVDPDASIRCKNIVKKVLPCGHSQDEECWKDPDQLKCDAMVTGEFTLCGHKMECKCSDKDNIKCNEKCNIRLDCGHQCVLSCHVDDDEDPDHINYKCKKTCSRECANNHRCKGKHSCYKPCPPCKELILRTLPCGHKAMEECCLEVSKCLEPCEKELPNCGHKCSNACFLPCGPCQVQITKTAVCGHDQVVACSEPALKEDCFQLVTPETLPSCGHKDENIPCKFDLASAQEMAIHCQEPCGFQFTAMGEKGCEHVCLGTCSECFQGRIHKKCQAPCGKQLVCGHRCDVRCSAVCPPCQKPCLMKCEHTACTKKCGDPCVPCKEKCSWKCPHSRCSKLCGEMCDRKPCNQPCNKKKLKCKHDCVGFCGEPCPPLCRICDEEQLTDIFFGYEDEPDARFVLLTDCGHTFEAKGLEFYLTGDDNGAVKARECPRCKTPIRNCRRFGNILRKFYNDVIAIKKRSLGNAANSERMRNNWIAQFRSGSTIEKVLPDIHARIWSSLVYEHVDRLTKQKTFKPKVIDEFSMRSLDFVADSAARAATELDGLSRNEKLTGPHFDEVIDYYQKTFSLMMDRHPLSRQEVMDFNKELDRADFFKQLMLRRSIPSCNPHNEHVYRTYLTARTIIFDSIQFTETWKQSFMDLMKELDEQLKSGLGITERERREILDAMGMRQGHWFKCPNGHLYVIGECGGATEEGVCNECGARIGGGDHRIRHDNAFAPEMDGAVAPAWPTTLQ